MTSLISAFIFEPVVRQARAFSTASHGERPALSAIPGVVSQPSRVSDRAAVKRATRHSTSSSASDVSATSSLLSLSAVAGDAFVPTDNPDVATRQEPTVVSTEEPPKSTAVHGHANLTQSPTRIIPHSSAVHCTFEDNFPPHTAHCITEPMRSAAATDERLPGLPPRGNESTVVQLHRNPDRGSSYTSPNTTLSAVIMSESLPADDGMRLLRQRIHEIRKLRVPSEEKAQRMHSLMTEKYRASQGHVQRPWSPSSTHSQERPFTPSSAVSFADVDVPLSSPASVSSSLDIENPYNLTLEDLKPTFCPAENHVDLVASAGSLGNEEEEPTLGCKHYKRNVKIQCFDCHRWHTCRHCHDQREDHHLNRRKTRTMLCMLCSTPQPAAEFCRNCQVRAAWHYCDICKLWDNDSTRSIYHCPDCGICRRGEGLGKDFIHCKRCNVCISIKYADDHRCIERATDADCPICKDYMFTSSTDVVSMKCGHYMHRDCYDAYMQIDYKCPMCKKSAVNMELQWRKLKDAVISQPMPAQFADTRVVINCNDCSVKSTSAYHWLGNQCAHCESFNTSELRLLAANETADDLGPDSPAQQAATPTSPRSCLAPVPRPVDRRSSGSYFLLAEREEREAREREREARRPSSADGSPFSPFEMLQRVRSLSPVRRFLGGSDDEVEGTAEDDSDDESVDEDDAEEEEEIEDEGGVDMLEGLELIGHR
ncbi:hypothetical protein IWX49DRAFT_599784 [Phyllosticta citricarpa]|uniref:Zf-CHY-domain-containing protein n=2 Tax=Phyllosticta TaxID=121621 RepID=A0ABR1MPG0_9PEZI